MSLYQFCLGKCHRCSGIIEGYLIMKIQILCVTEKPKVAALIRKEKHSKRPFSKKNNLIKI